MILDFLLSDSVLIAIFLAFWIIIGIFTLTLAVGILRLIFKAGSK